MKNLYQTLISEQKKSAVRFLSIYHHAVFLSGKNVGLSSMIHTHHHQILDDVGSLHLKTTKELSSLLISENYLARSIGLAAINSEVNSPELLKRNSQENALEILLRKGEGKNVAMLGDFPRLKQLREGHPFKNLWAFEMNPPDETYYTPKDYSTILPQADVVLFTAVTLINHTILEFFPYIKNSFKILTGPSAPLHPLLFDYGIDAICSSVVTCEEEAKLYLSQGASYRSAKGIEKVTLLRDTHAR